ARTGEQRQDRGQRRLGEKLLAPEDDDEEARGIARRCQQQAPRRVRQIGPDHRHDQEGEAHRHAGGEARDRQRQGRALDLLLALLAHHFVDDQRARRAQRRRLLALLGIEPCRRLVPLRHPRPLCLPSTAALTKRLRLSQALWRAPSVAWFITTATWPGLASPR